MSPYDLVPGKTGADKGRPLTGWMVLAMLLAFFGVIGAVNARHGLFRAVHIQRRGRGASL